LPALRACVHRLLLGQIYKANGELQTAADCNARAVEAEFAAPLGDPFVEDVTLVTGTDAWL